MHIGDCVRIYYECQWFDADVCFDEGKVEEIADGHIVVDFLDWKSRWHVSELQMGYPVTGDVLVANAPGVIIRDYRPQAR